MPTPFSFSGIITVSDANSNTIDSLIHGLRWENPVISYSFPSSTSRWSADPLTGYGPREEPWSRSYTPITPSNQSDFIAALRQWEAIADIEFEQITETENEVGDIRIAYTDIPGFSDAEAWAYLPAYGIWSGDIWVNQTSRSAQQEWVAGSFSFLTILHEIGHALGLTHPFDDPSFPAENNTMSSTIMSYSAIPGDQNSFFDYYPTTPMPLDIKAIQHIYRANSSHHPGDNIITYNDDDTFHETIWDSGGIDTISYSGNQAAYIQLEEGQGSFIGNPVFAISNVDSTPVPNIWIAYDTVIENASGGQNNDELYGNQFNNTLSGHNGNDILIGKAGNDTLLGGGGIDIARFDGKLSDYMLSKTNEGYSILHQAGDEGRDLLINIERLQFDNTGLALDINGHAGQIAKLLGVIFGAASVSNHNFVGLGLSAIDNGNNDEQLISLGLNAAGIHDNDALVTLLWHNLLGYDPSADEKSLYLEQLNSDQISAAELTLLAANTQINADNIDLVGLAQTGIEFGV